MDEDFSVKMMKPILEIPKMNDYYTESTLFNTNWYQEVLTPYIHSLKLILNSVYAPKTKKLYTQKKRSQKFFVLVYRDKVSKEYNFA